MDLGDVHELIKAYQDSGGHIPLMVLVAEVQALQQAATRLQSTVRLYTRQVEQIRDKTKLVEKAKEVLQERKEQGNEGKVAFLPVCPPKPCPWYSTEWPSCS